MTYFQNQNDDNISNSSISSSISSLSISPNNERPDLESKYKSLNKTLNDLRTKVENITQKPNEDSKENSKFDSFAFIKEFWNECTNKSKEIFAITFDLFLDKTIESLVKVLINPKVDNQLREEWKDWHHFEIPEEIYDNEFSLVNIPYLAMYLLDIFKSKQKIFIENVEKTLKVH